MRWLSGGASKLQIAFELNWTNPEPGRKKDLMVLRMEPAESLNATSRRREFQLLKEVRNAVPVPQVYWLDAEARWFPRPAFVYAFVEGVTSPSEVERKITGTGQHFPWNPQP